MQIISATPGPTTTERILELIITHPHGITVKELSNQLNRPVSMINHCLKSLTSAKKVYTKLTDDGKQWIYYPYLLSCHTFKWSYSEGKKQDKLTNNRLIAPH